MSSADAHFLPEMLVDAEQGEQEEMASEAPFVWVVESSAGVVEAGLQSESGVRLAEEDGLGEGGRHVPMMLQKGKGRRSAEQR